LKLSILIPARDEVDSIAATVHGVTTAMRKHRLDYEVLVVDDHSADGTAEVVAGMAADDANIRALGSTNPPGFGYTIRAGLEKFNGEAVAIVMADGSDDPDDLIRYHHLLEEGYDCAFGSRFVPGANRTGYPRLKLVINRIANWLIRILFRHGLNDTTNAFKAYRREVIDGVQPLLSNHFNLTVEMPLKAVVRGFSYTVVPVSWRSRKQGISKLGLREMGSRYLFIVLYVWLESHLSRGDYRRRKTATRMAGRVESPR
jgi:dolichol-phosphate mannosyltransferase